MPVSVYFKTITRGREVYKIGQLMAIRLKKLKQQGGIFLYENQRNFGGGLVTFCWHFNLKLFLSNNPFKNQATFYCSAAISLSPY